MNKFDGKWRSLISHFIELEFSQHASQWVLLCAEDDDEVSVQTFTCKLSTQWKRDLHVKFHRKRYQTRQQCSPSMNWLSSELSEILVSSFHVLCM